MIGRCMVCGARFAWRRSRTLCSRHYWRLRRLEEKTPWQLEELVRESEFTKKMIAMLHNDDRTHEDVAEPQRDSDLP